MEEHLHPSIREFKKFLKKHPELVREVRKNGKQWQEYYEKWMVLGEDDPHWSQYQKEENENIDEKKNQSELFDQLLKMTEKIDLDDVQNQVQQLSGTVATIQEMMGQFQKNKTSSSQSINHSRPFHWFRD